jgi:hypothetical protein
MPRLNPIPPLKPQRRPARLALWVASLFSGLALAGAAQAQSLSLLQNAPLRADRQADAATLATLNAGQAVQLLQMSGGWVQVQVQGGATAPRGWLRASQLRLPGAEVAAASQQDTGRRQAGASAVTLGVRQLPARSNRHALVVGVGQYQHDAARPVAPLAGVQHDMASALAMARLLQVPPEQMTLLRDSAATREGVQQALQALQARMKPGDRAFIYWSGHGSRYMDKSAGGCVEALVPYDLKDISHAEFAAWVQPLAAQADKLMVVFDACHSGTAATGPTRSLPGGGSAPLFTPKFTAGADACQVATNVRQRAWGQVAPGLGVSGQDVVHLSSSRPDEVSFDNAQTGGLATSSLRQCLQGEARDLDGSGNVSVQELVACAQAKVDQALQGQRDLLPHHLVVSGNRDFVPAYFAQAPAPTPPQASFGGPRPPAVAGPTPGATTPAANEAPGLGQVLAQLHAQRDSKRRVSVQPSQERLRIGRDGLDFSITSSHAGHVYVAMLGSDQRSLYLLFPNSLDADNRIAAGQTLVLPRAHWQVTAGGPPGEDQVLVMVSDQPRPLEGLSPLKDGPFTKALTDSAGRARLQWLLGQGQGGASDSFGSALFRLTEY